MIIEMFKFVFYVCKMFCIMTFYLFEYVLHYGFDKGVSHLNTLQINYLKIIKNDWWRLYKKRCIDRSETFIETTSSTLEILSKDRRNWNPIRDSGYIERKDLLEHVQNGLTNDELHLRDTHLSFCYRMGREDQIMITRCINCSLFLTRMALFVSPYYYCINCIKNEMIPRFLWDRYSLMRRSELIQCHDIIESILCRIVALSFDTEQIRLICNNRKTDFCTYPVCNCNTRFEQDDDKFVRSLTSYLDGLEIDNRLTLGTSLYPWYWTN